MIARKLIFSGLLGVMLHSFAPLGICAEVDKHIFVDVQNPHPSERVVVVVDDLCGSEVFRGPLTGHGRQPIELCAEEFRGASVTISNLRSGAEKRFRKVLHGATLPVP